MYSFGSVEEESEDAELEDASVVSPADGSLDSAPSALDSELAVSDAALSSTGGGSIALPFASIANA